MRMINHVSNLASVSAKNRFVSNSLEIWKRFVNVLKKSKRSDKEEL